VADRYIHLIDRLLEDPERDLIGALESITREDIGAFTAPTRPPTSTGSCAGTPGPAPAAGVSAELDPLAPVAPPGAMFMARPEALRTLSEGAKELVRLPDRAALRDSARQALDSLSVGMAVVSPVTARTLLNDVAGRVGVMAGGGRPAGRPAGEEGDSSAQILSRVDAR